MNCGDFLALSGTERESVATRLSAQGYLNVSIPIEFGPTGTRQPSTAEYLGAACGQSTELELIAVGVGSQEYPSCSDFVALAPDIQIEWAAAVWDLIEYGSPPAKEDEQPLLIQACASSGDEVPVGDAARAILDVLAERERGAASFSFNSVDSQGYTFKEDVAVEPLVVTVDTANAPPGEALVTISGRATLTVTSTNTGKNAPVSPIVTNTTVGAFWPGQAGLCDTSLGARGPSHSVDDLTSYPSFDYVGCLVSFNTGYLSGAVLASAGGPTLTNGASATFELIAHGDQFRTTADAAAAIVAAVEGKTHVWIAIAPGSPIDGTCGSSYLYNLVVSWAAEEISGCAVPNVG